MRRLPVLVALAATLASAPGTAATPLPDPSASLPWSPPKVDLGAPRLGFVPNEGQWPSEVLFATPLGTPTVMVLEDRLVVQLFEPWPEGAGDPPDHKAHVGTEASRAQTVRGVNVVLRWKGTAGLLEDAPRGNAPRGVGPRQARVHTYLGRDPARWGEHLPCYEGVTYRDLAPGLDLVVGRDDAGLDLTLVGSHGDRFGFTAEGATLREDGEGRLVATTHLGTTVLGRVARVDPEGPAPLLADVITTGPGPLTTLPGAEPVPEYSTFFGGPRHDRALDVALVEEATGPPHMLVCGRTSAAVFSPLLPGPFETEAQGLLDGLVARLTPRGDGFLWASFVGGGSRDELTGLDVSDDGSGGHLTHLSGYTDSVDFPIQGAGGGAPLQGTHAGQTDAVGLKLLDDGSLDWSTFLGGSLSGPGTGLDVAWDVELDGDGCVYLAGFTTSEDFPVTAGAYSDDINGPLPSTLSDGFVTKLTPDGDAFVYSTYLSGDKCDEAADICVDAEGRVSTTGIIDSDAFTDFGTVPGAQPVAFPALLGDNAYTLTLNPDGTGIVHGTFLAGEGNDGGRAVEVHGDHVWVVGFSNSVFFPVINALDPVFDGSQEAFAAKIDWTTGAFVFSTFLGGSSRDIGWAVARAPDGDVWVAGETDSSDFNGLTADHDASHAGRADAFVLRLDSDGTVIEMGTLVGGAGDDIAYALAVDDDGTRALLGGMTSSTDFPVHAAKALDPGHNGGTDGFLTRLEFP